MEAQNIEDYNPPKVKDVKPKRWVKYASLALGIAFGAVFSISVTAGFIILLLKLIFIHLFFSTSAILLPAAPLIFSPLLAYGCRKLILRCLRGRGAFSKRDEQPYATYLKHLKWGFVAGLLIIAGLAIALLAYSIVSESMNPYEDCVGDRCDVVKKPVVYLYPPHDMNVSVKLITPGKIVKSEPPYRGGWTVSVTKEGIIEGRYPYLFYEVAIKQIERPSNGWVVPYDSLGSWFDEKLPELGLSSPESKDLKDYWMSSLPKSRYYQIALFSDEYLRRNIDLVVDPEPDTEIRLLFYFKPLQESKALEEPEVTTPKRKGFTLVEWGGVLDT